MSKPHQTTSAAPTRHQLTVFGQLLKLSGFVGHSANAIRWQVWTALLVYVLLRFAAHLSQWRHSFVRVFTVVRAAMWERLDLLGLLRSYGTAGGSFTLLGAMPTAWLPGLDLS
jgi:hypothetical protein